MRDYGVVRYNSSQGLTIASEIARSTIIVPDCVERSGHGYRIQPGYFTKADPAFREAVKIQFIMLGFGFWWKTQFVLTELRLNLASHLERSFSIHSYGYGSSNNRPICFAKLTLKFGPFMNYPG